jgi:hypothetical protein
MFRWIENAWLCESDDTTYTVFREQRGNAKGIVMNCRDFPVPQEPIWKDGVYKADSLVQMLSVLSSQK